MQKTGFNFGAFICTSLFFGGHKAYGLMLLSFFLFLIPGVNIIWKIICGIKGPKWVYNRSDFSDEEFEGSMETWNRGGIVNLVFFVIVLIIYSIVALLGFTEKDDEQDTQYFEYTCNEMQLDEPNV